MIASKLGERKSVRGSAAGRLLPAATLAALALGASPLAAEEPIVPISGLSPYPEGVDCNVTPQTGTVWRNSETEPYMDVDFGAPEHMAAIVHQDRWSNGSAQSTATFYSDDGGETWTLADTPITRCSGGLQSGPESFDRASDPWLTVTPAEGRRFGDGDDDDNEEGEGDGGIFHQMSLMTDRLPPFTGELRSAYSMLRSTDGGKTWSDPIVVNNLTEFDKGAPFNDKNSLTADPNKKRFVYGTWQLLKDVLPDDDSAIPLLAFYSDTFFVRSRNKGRSWEPSRAIYKIRNDTTLLAQTGIDPNVTPIIGAQNIGHQIVVLPDGRLVNVSQGVFATGNVFVDFRERVIIRSFDNGRTWEQTATVIPSNTLGGFVQVDAELANGSGGAVVNQTRTAGSIPDIAVNRTNGFIYVVFQNVDANLTFIGTFMTMSKDGGDTWSDEILVSGGQAKANGNPAFAQLPAVHVADDGTVGVLFFDDRNDIACPDLTLTNEQNPECFTVLPDGSVKAGPLSNDWFFQTYDGELNLIDERRVTQESFDLRQAPVARGYFPGDYVNCTSTDNDFVCAYSLPNNLGSPVKNNPSGDVLGFEDENRQDMVFTRFPGVSVCDFGHTLTSFRDQLRAAEIRIPRRARIERFEFLGQRFEEGCQVSDRDNDDDDDEGDLDD